MLLLALACTSAPDDSATSFPLPSLGEQLQVVPGAGLPDEVTPQPSNNNLDIVEHEGRYYLPFRTGPEHFASDQVVLYVMSSADRQTWTHELTIDMDTDLREPRLLSWQGQLILHFAVLGTNPLDFEPQGTMRTVFSDGEWSEPEWIFEDGFIPWRTRVVDGVPTMIGYTGGDDIYDPEGDELPQLQVKWLQGEDGFSWEGPTVWTGGGSETDFAFTEDGTLVAVVRNEAGDAQGFGSLICRGEAEDPADWTCEHDCRKYDSPLVFEHGGHIWLIGRRNVTEDGCFDLGAEGLTHEEAFLQYSVAYWQEPKRCALWHVDPDSLAVTHALDLPSAGDTCFPSILELEPGVFEVWNYTSDPSDPDISWLDGQKGETWIVRQTLTW